MAVVLVSFSLLGAAILVYAWWLTSWLRAMRKTLAELQTQRKLR